MVIFDSLGGDAVYLNISCVISGDDCTTNQIIAKKNNL